MPDITDPTIESAKQAIHSTEPNRLRELGGKHFPGACTDWSNVPDNEIAEFLEELLYEDYILVGYLIRDLGVPIRFMVWDEATDTEIEMSYEEWEEWKESD